MTPTALAAAAALTAATALRPLRFALDGRTVFLEVPRQDGLDLLEWLGLGRPEFGAIEATALRPLCRRRLWPEPRNLAPLVSAAHPGSPRIRETSTLRQIASQIVDTLGDTPTGLVHFG